MHRKEFHQFEPTTNTSSVTICKWCGQEKFLHTPKVEYMVQQTAVEYLLEKLYTEYRFEFSGTIVDQAKQMEKQQRITDYNIGYQDAQCNHVNDAENYANEQDYLNG
jgi:hypothetical protein